MDDQPDATPAKFWLDHHAGQLAQLAGEHTVDLGLVRLAAILVLAGLTDIEILHELSGHHVSSDGERDPLAGLPATLDALRAMVASSPER